MPERYKGGEPDPMLPALYDVAETLGAEPNAYQTNEAYGLPMPGESQGYVTDPELVALLDAASQQVGPDVLNRLLETHDPFNHTVWVHDEYGNVRPDNYFGHRLFLRDLPRYADAARKAGLSIEQMEGLLTHTLQAEQYPDIPGSQNVTAYLTKAVEASVRSEEQLTEDDVARLRGMITKAGPDDAIELSFATYTAGREAGLDLEASVNIVEGHLATANYRQIGYNMWTLIEALRALNVGTVDPALTTEVFGALEHEHPEYRKDSYMHLKDTLEILCPARGETPQELMQTLATHLRSGLSFDDALDRVVDGGTPLPSGDEHVTVIVPREEQERYFPRQRGELKHGVLPYQVERSLNDGLRDLEKLTQARSNRGDVVAEGAWAFDPDSSTWYSLGGSTTYIPSGARHSSIAYDLSRLSDKPHVFHIHPNEFAIGADQYGFVFPSNADYRSVATIMQDAERPIHPRSFISHPFGVTEFTFPDDPQRIQEVAEVFQGMRDALFARFGHDSRDIQDAALRIGKEQFVAMMVRDVNAHLPEGFAIRLHPQGADLERLLAEE
jgi:hypothetical protein